MELLNYINSHENWEQELSQMPYSLKISHNGPYVLFKYQQFLSDMGLRICQEARGAIFRKDEEGHYVPISVALWKFFNATEPYADTDILDWNSAIISEKVDGSLCRLAYDHYDKIWLLSSNGTIFARDVDAGNTNFEEIFIHILGGKKKYEELLEKLNKDYCYFFEMVSPYNVICIHYNEPAIYYLGRRNMITMKEDDYVLKFDNIKHPKTYKLFSLSDCTRAAEEYKNDFEGFVVRDAEWHRVKIKTPWYIAIHKMRGNGPLTVLRVVEMFQAGTLDDFVAYYPEFKDFTDDVVQRIRYYIEVCDTAFKVVISVVGAMGERRDFAMYANTYMPIVRSFLYARLDEKVKDGSDYLMNMRARTLASYIMAEMETTKIGAVEDE